MDAMTNQGRRPFVIVRARRRITVALGDPDQGVDRGMAVFPGHDEVHPHEGQTDSEHEDPSRNRAHSREGPVHPRNIGMSAPLINEAQVEGRAPSQ